MKCPACKNPLCEKGAGGMWFDATELECVSAQAAKLVEQKQGKQS